ncbi:S-layer homology domain-containing protein [Paenibacillus sp. 598K]|uniref:S-layer homology domain-containing protein n=1 Tax=Paenibacillus sp. 598K TaxID=1117987 RepID=UPI0021AA1381|nr:S-layer homology domain-containing protein [Paenibacillus sp. 598K]
MQKRGLAVFLLICLLASIANVGPDVGKAAAADQNVIKNGGFESAIGNVPDGWSVAMIGNLDAEATVDATEKRSGNSSLKIVNRQSETPNTYMNIHQAVSVKPNTKYRISVWVKGNNVDRVRLTMSWDPTFGEEVGGFKGTYDWKLLEYEMTTGLEQKSFNFMIISDGITDALWIDDISVVEVGTSGGGETPTLQALLEMYAELEGKLPQLEALMAQSREQKIAIDYETINYTIIQNYLKWGRVDLDAGNASRAYYILNELKRQYDEATDNMSAYLAGTKQARPVPRYQSGALDIDGFSFIADTKTSYSDEIVRRPVFFNGYGHFQQVREDVPNFSGFGNNMIQIEMGPNSLIKALDNVAGWSFNTNGTDMAFFNDSRERRSGTASLHLKGTFGYGPNRWASMLQPIQVEPRTAYTLSVWTKGSVGKGFFSTSPNWEPRYYLNAEDNRPVEHAEWTEHTFTFNTGDSRSITLFYVSEEGGNFYMDDITLATSGGPNLVANGDFDEGGYIYHPEGDQILSEMTSGNSEHWDYFATGADLKFTVMETAAHSGSYAVHVKNNTPLTPHAYGRMSQNVAVKPNTDYTLSAWVKGEVGRTAFAVTGNWDPRYYIAEQPQTFAEWTQVSFDIRTGNASSLPLTLINEELSDFYLDDIALIEKGTTANQVKNGSFDHSQAIYNGGYKITTEPVKEDIVRVLAEAETHHIAVNLLLSPHYFPEFAYEQWPAVKNPANPSFIRFSVNHPKARELEAAFLQTIIPLIKDYRSLHSITLTNEPMYDTRGDSYAVQVAWPAYLSEAYGTIESLNTAYGSQYTGFKEVPMPALNPALGQPYYDWRDFNYSYFAAWHEWMAGLIRELAPDVLLHTKILDSDRHFGIGSGVDLEQFAEFLDINGNDEHNYLGMGVDGFTRKTKLYDMQGSYRTAPVFNSEDHVIQDYSQNYSPEQATHVYTDMWQGAVHGKSAATIWVWEWATATDTSDAFSGSIMHRPEVVKAVGMVTLDTNRLSSELTALQHAPREVAILDAYTSRIYNGMATSNVQDKWYKALSFNGFRTDFISERQIEAGKLNNYKLLIVPGSTHITTEALEGIADYVRSGGKVILSGEAALGMNKASRPSDPALLGELQETAVKIDSNSLGELELRDELAKHVAGLGKYEVQLVHPDSGELIYGVEWLQAEYRNQLLINIANYTDQAKSAKLLIDGKPVGTVAELIRGEEVDGQTMRIASKQPMLLAVERYPIVPIADLTATAGNGQASLSFSSATGAQSVVLEQSSDGGKTWLAVDAAKLDETSTSVVAGGLSNGTTYRFRLQVIGGSREGQSNEATVTPFAPSTGGGNYGNNGSGHGEAGNGQEQPGGPDRESSVTIGAGEVLVVVPAKGGVAEAEVNEQQLAFAREQSLTGKPLELRIETAPDSEAADAYAITLPEVAGAASEFGYRVVTPLASVELPATWLASRKLRQSKQLTVRISRADADFAGLAEYGGRPAIRLDLLADGKPLPQDHSAGSVAVVIPYAATAQERAAAAYLTVWMLGADGQVIAMPDARYDAGVGAVSFTTRASGSYAIVFVQQPFTDLAGYSWAQQAIEELAAKGIIQGVGGQRFAPAASITRGDYMLLLVRTLGLDADFTSSFADVAATDYYYDALGIAKTLGIAQGTGNNNFQPERTITRQEMMVLTARALELTGRLQPSGAEPKVLDAFKDRGEVASYALESMAALVQAGLIQGSGGALLPGKLSSRAESAVFLYRIYNLQPAQS